MYMLQEVLRERERDEGWFWRLKEHEDNVIGEREMGEEDRVKEQWKTINCFLKRFLCIPLVFVNS